MQSTYFTPNLTESLCVCVFVWCCPKPEVHDQQRISVYTRSQTLPYLWHMSRNHRRISYLVLLCVCLFQDDFVFLRWRQFHHYYHALFRFGWNFHGQETPFLISLVFPSKPSASCRQYLKWIFDLSISLQCFFPPFCYCTFLWLLTQSPLCSSTSIDHFQLQLPASEVH